MKNYIIAKGFLLFISLAITTSYAQKRKIIIDEDLLKNSKEFKVIKEYKKKSIEFISGEYVIVESDINKGKVNKKFANNTEIQSTESNYSFKLKNSSGVIASVFAHIKESYKYEDKKNLLDILSGEDDTFEITEIKRLKTVSISIDSKTGEEWVLKYDYSFIKGVKKHKRTFINSNRIIEIVDAIPIKSGHDKWSSAAAGYEFMEKGHSLAAYQLQGGGKIGFGSKQKLIWLRTNIDEDTKLVLMSLIAAL